MVSGLNIGRNALVVNQAALSVVSNNIANMSTEGYSKQRVNMTALSSNTIATTTLQKAQQGLGVDLESISRYRSASVDSYYRSSLGSKNYYDLLATNGTAIENIANEFTGTGLSSYLDSFFTAANNLSLYPTDVSMKTDFIEKTMSLTNQINSISTQLQDARTNLVGDVNDPTSLDKSQVKIYTDEINQILSDIASVNESVIYQNNITSDAANGLLDQRDQLLDKLSEYIPFTTTENLNGGINVSLGNVQLVSGNEVKGSFQVSVGDENNPAVVSFENNDGYTYIQDVKDSLGSKGNLSAILTLGGDSTTELTIKSLMDDLDTIAGTLAQEINNLQLKSEAGPPQMAAAYYDSTTEQLELSTQAIFSTNDGSSTITAANICINPAISSSKAISTAYVELNDDGTIKNPDEIGNNEIAQAMYELRDEKLAGLSGQTFETFNASLTTDFASKLADAKTNLETQENVYDAAYTQRESTSGVNIEEELVDLVKYQRAYEASARIFTVSDEILETVVNLGR